MNNQALHLVDINGNKMLNVFDAQSSINTILGSNAPRLVYTSTVHNEQPDLSQNHIDLDMSGDFIDNNELHTARIFPKKSTVPSDLNKDFKKFETITSEIVCKLFSILVLWSTKLFYIILRALTTFDVMVENYLMEKSNATSFSVEQDEIPTQVLHVAKEQIPQTEIIQTQPKIHVLPVTQYAVQSRPVVITHVPKKVEYVPAYVPPVVTQENIQEMQKIQTPHIQTQARVQKVKKRSTTLQVLALVAAEIIYGKQLSNIDSI